MTPLYPTQSELDDYTCGQCGKSFPLNTVHNCPNTRIAGWGSAPPRSGIIEGSDLDRLAAIRLALEFRGMGRAEDVLAVIDRLTRHVHVDGKATEPTRMMIEAVKIERPVRT